MTTLTGAYELLRPLRHAPPFFLARDADGVLVVKNTLVVRVLSQEPHLLFHQAEKLLLATDCPSIPTFLTSGYDEKSGSRYYVMLLGSTGTVNLLSALTAAELRASLPSVVAALADAHHARIAYRYFESESFLLCGSQLYLYDVHQAAAMAPDNTVPAVPSRRPYDPPEALVGGYDAVRGDIFGLGTWLKSLAMPGDPLAELAERMTRDDPFQRPGTMDEIVSELQGLP